MSMLSELFHGMLHSTPQGFIGVGLIFIYMMTIIVTAMIRIKQGLKEHH